MKTRNIIMPLLFCLYLTGVALLCFMHEEAFPNVSKTIFGFPAEKVAHFVMFLPFLPLSYFTFRKKRQSKFVKFVILTLLLALGAGTAYLTEIIQERLGYRSYEMSDFHIDCMGLGVGYVLITIGILLRKSRKRR